MINLSKVLQCNKELFVFNKLFRNEIEVTTSYITIVGNYFDNFNINNDISVYDAIEYMQEYEYKVLHDIKELNKLIKKVNAIFLDSYNYLDFSKPYVNKFNFQPLKKTCGIKQLK